MDDKVSSSTQDNGSLISGEENGRQNTLNDLLSLPGIIPFDDNMLKLCEEIEALNHEELFRKVSEITQIQNYPFDLRAYWLIDIIAGFLINGKRDGLSNENLWAALVWFTFIFNGFKENKWTHESLMQHIQSVTLASAQEVKMRDQPMSLDDNLLKTITSIPKEELVQNIPSKSKQKRSNKKMASIPSIEIFTQQSKVNKMQIRTKMNSTSKPEVQYTLEDLLIITKIFYDLFATSFQFKLLQWSLLDLDQVIILEFPHLINIARDLKVPPSPVQCEPIKSGSVEELNLKGSDKKLKKKTKGQSETGKSNELASQRTEETTKSKDKKSKKKNESLLQDDKRKEKQILQNGDEIAKPDEIQENWIVDDNIYILPLQEAAGIGKDFFLRLFPDAEEESEGNKINISNKKQGKKNKKGK